MFDPNVFEVQGVALIALVFGLVEFIKNMLDWSGKRVTLLAASLGVVLYVLYRLLEIVPEPYGQILGIGLGSLAFGLSASGYYKFLNQRLPKPGEWVESTVEPFGSDQRVG